MHLKSSVWAALGDRFDEPRTQARIIAGMSWRPFPRDHANMLTATSSAVLVSSGDALAFFVGRVNEASADLQRVAGELNKDADVIAKVIKAKGKALAENGDVAGIDAISDEIADLAKIVPDSRVQRIADVVGDAIEEDPVPPPFDLQVLHDAFARLSVATADVAKARNRIDALRQEIADLRSVAVSPATAKRLRDQSREVVLRDRVPGLLADLRAARTEAAGALARVDAVLVQMEAINAA